MSSQTWATTGGRGVVENICVERGDAVRLGGRDGQAPAGVLEGRLADPPDAGLDRVEDRQQEVAAARARRGRPRANRSSDGTPRSPPSQRVVAGPRTPSTAARSSADARGASVTRSIGGV